MSHRAVGDCSPKRVSAADAGRAWLGGAQIVFEGQAEVFVAVVAFDEDFSVGLK